MSNYSNDNSFTNSEAREMWITVVVHPQNPSFKVMPFMFAKQWHNVVQYFLFMDI